MSTLDPFATAANVHTRSEFVSHVVALRADLLKNGAEWENTSLEKFLEAMSAWVQDMDGFFHGRGETPPAQPTWALFAQALCAAAIYE